MGVHTPTAQHGQPNPGVPTKQNRGLRRCFQHYQAKEGCWHHRHIYITAKLLTLSLITILWFFKAWECRSCIIDHSPTQQKLRQGLVFLKAQPPAKVSHTLLGYVKTTQSFWEEGLMEQSPALSHIFRHGDAQRLLPQAPSQPQHPKPDQSFGKHIRIHSPLPSPKNSPLPWESLCFPFHWHPDILCTSPSLLIKTSMALGWLWPFIFSPLSSQFSQICCSWLSSEDLLSLTCSVAPMGPAPWAPGPFADPAQLHSLG